MAGSSSASSPAICSNPSFSASDAAKASVSCNARTMWPTYVLYRLTTFGLSPLPVKVPCRMRCTAASMCSPPSLSRSTIGVGGAWLLTRTSLGGSASSTARIFGLRTPMKVAVRTENRVVTGRKK